MDRRKIVITAATVFITLLSFSGLVTGTVGAVCVIPCHPTRSFANEADGVVKFKSHSSFQETVARLDAAIKGNPDLKIVARVDHAANATVSGQELRPTILFIFGNPRMGTPLMSASQTAALDLPQKMIVFEDENRFVYVAYNDPAFVARRHGIAENHPVVKNASVGLRNLAAAAIRK